MSGTGSWWVSTTGAGEMGGAEGRRRSGRVRWIGRAAALVTLAVTMAACGGSGSSAPTTSTTAAATATTPSTAGGKVVPVSASPGCGNQGTDGTATLTPTIGGRSRVVIVHLPSGYQASKPEPLVLNMHGSQSTALEQEGLSGMNATADADSFIVAYPQGDISAGTGFEWNVPGQPLFGGAARTGRQLPTTCRSSSSWSRCSSRNTASTATGCTPPASPVVPGWPASLACDASTSFAAVGPVSGLRFPNPCPSTRPVPVISFHGTSDPVDPYLGNGQKYWTYSVPVAAQRWATHNGCTTATVTHPVVTVTQTSNSNCTGGADVQLYTIAGEGHEWPGGPHLRKVITRVLGPQTTAISANSTMWAFFVAHPLP